MFDHGIHQVASKLLHLYVHFLRHGGAGGILRNSNALKVLDEAQQHVQQLLTVRSSALVETLDLLLEFLAICSRKSLHLGEVRSTFVAQGGI